MLLFLDVISPIPEFFVIEDNKVIFHEKIVSNQFEKLSDNIFENYIKINDNLNLSQNLKKISMTIGPGSYTSLRVGAAFLSGLKISKNLGFCPISIKDIIKFKSKTHKIENIGFFINSSKDQNFFCSLNHQNKMQYVKVEDNNFALPKNLKIIFYNSKKFNNNINEIEQKKFTFIGELIKNNHSLVFSNNEIIKPIYISNNKILN